MPLVSDFNNLDTSKYKRFFVIGCSFTEWFWPTWANIIAEDNPHLEFKQYAKPGCGNSYISTLLNQLQHAEGLCETDLVGIMWSTFHRRDYYNSSQTNNLRELIMNNDAPFHCNSSEAWHSHGDQIHSQLNSNTGGTNGFCDRGFLIRDLAIIDNTTTVIENADYTAFEMFSVAPDQQQLYDPAILSRTHDDVLDMYKHLDNKMIAKTSLLTVLGGHYRNITVKWTPPWAERNSGVIEEDKHPSSSVYCQFLQSNGYTVTPETIHNCINIDAKIQHTAWAMDLQNDPDWKYHVSMHPPVWPL
tara:strand:+ start:621 stop:1526 length:906 start_codon:yes stop_codon:yes gene_type:complete